MTQTNENEATGTDELSAGVAHKIGVEMGLWRMKHRSVSVQSHEILLEYIVLMEKEITEFIGKGSQIPCHNIYTHAEDIVLERAMKQAMKRVWNQ